MSEVGKLLEATKPFRDEIAKLHASVEHWKRQAGATDAAFLKEEKALEAAELQVGVLRDILNDVRGLLYQHGNDPDVLVRILRRIEDGPENHKTNEPCKELTDEERRAAKEAQDRKFRPPDWMRSGRHG